MAFWPFSPDDFGTRADTALGEQPFLHAMIGASVHVYMFTGQALH